MNERVAADQFTHWVDQLLAHADKGEPFAAPPVGLAEDAILAARLMRTDFTRASRALPGLSRLGPQNLGPVRPRPPVLSRLLRPLPIAASALLAAAVLVQCTYPGGIVGLGKAVKKLWVERIELGATTTAMQQTPQQLQAEMDELEARSKDLGFSLAAVPRPGQPSWWSIEVAGLEWGGGAPEGVAPVVSRYTAWPAVATAPFAWRVPQYVPEGYTLYAVYVPPEKNIIIAEYRGRGQVFGIAQTRLDGGGIMTQVSDSAAPALHAATLADGTKAAWFESATLVWESAYTSNLVVGRALSLAEALQIAEGLR